MFGTMSRLLVTKPHKVANQWLEFITLGLVTSWQQQLEHFAVEAKELTEQTLVDIETLAQRAESQHEFVESISISLNTLNQELLAISIRSCLNFWSAPVTLWYQTPNPRRFPVTLEGEFEVVQS